jgi:hypothetical protein
MPDRRTPCTLFLFSEAETMAEVLVRFIDRVRDDRGALYSAQACGGVASDGLWDGWIEFVGENDVPLRSPRETKQPNRDALVYWAEGLTAAYLEGALRRALDTLVEPTVRVPSPEPSIFSEPADPGRAARQSRSAHPVLDPFATYAQGEGILRQQLSALSRDHLLTLIDAYALPIDQRASTTDRELADEIVDAVRRLATST